MSFGPNGGRIGEVSLYNLYTFLYAQAHNDIQNITDLFALTKAEELPFT